LAASGVIAYIGSKFFYGIFDREFEGFKLVKSIYAVLAIATRAVAACVTARLSMFQPARARGSHRACPTSGLISIDQRQPPAKADISQWAALISVPSGASLASQTSADGQALGDNKTETL
jgi:hypothetical protein